MKVNKLLFKNEGNERGVIVGPLWILDEDGSRRNYRDGNRRSDGKFFADWFSMPDALSFALKLGVDLEEV